MSQSDTHLRSALVLFPEHFLGVFEKNRERFAPLLAEARQELQELPVPAHVYENYRHAALDHPQPSFMLLPMLYLVMADHTGGITRKHREYLPFYMLAMELVAVL